MRKIYLQILFIFGLLTASNALYAQEWVRQMENDDANFYQVREEFEAYWKDKAEGKGYKQFKRWEWFWQQRVSPDGVFPDPGAVVAEWKAYTDQIARQALRLTQTARWQQLGPASSEGGYSGLGRINCMGFHPTDINTFWVGSAGGGLWKTTNGGLTWTSNTDNLPVLGISGIAVNYNNPSIMYIATGDGNNKYNSMGVMKSRNGGETWEQTSLNWAITQQGRISALIMHPTNPEILLAASRSGIHRTTNGGASWQVVQSGWFTEIKFMPGSATVLVAAGRQSSGGTQIMRSSDTGATWEKTGDFPDAGRLALAVTAADPKMVRVVASNVKDNGFEGLYTSLDEGKTFAVTYAKDQTNLLHNSYNGVGTGGQGWYDLTIAISPTDPNQVFVGGVNTWKSEDGGLSWKLRTMWYSDRRAVGVAVVHADKHNLVYHPLDNSVLFECNDGGIYKSVDGGTTWDDLSNMLQITQFYRVAVAASSSALLLAGAQDNGSKMRFGTNWRDVTGGDGMDNAVEYTNPDIMYSSSQNGNIYRTKDAFKTQATLISGNIPGKPKGAWITPFVIDPVKPETLYAAYKDVYKTEDRGDTWIKLSTDLSTTELIYLTVAPSQADIMYTGSGKQLFKSVNGGTEWQNITSSLPVTLASITAIAVNPINAAHVLITMSGFSVDNKVFVTKNGGETWTNISEGIPNIPVNCIVFRDGNSGEIFIGTDFGVFFRDDDIGWQPFNDGLPNIMVMDLEVHHGESKLIAATYGRGVWMTDLSAPNMPAILGFTPERGNTGSDITITGSNFAGATLVKINESTAVIKTVTPNYIIVTVPDGATTGKISVTTPSGSITSNSIYTVDVVTAAGEDNLSQKISVFPNPATSELWFKLSNMPIKRVIITSNVGAVVKTVNEQQQDFSVNISDLQAGLYHVRIETAAGKFVMRKIVKL